MKKPASGKSGRGRGRSAGAASSASSIEAGLADLEGRLGHVFADKALLALALTHSSAAANASNERLEFLGDRVLGLVLAARLYAAYPEADEGELTRKFHALARREACVSAGEAAGLPDRLILAAGEAESGGRRKAAIVGGAVEAVIAALYLDGGMPAAEAFIARYWQEMFDRLGRDMRDAKTVLQEWAQAREGNRAVPTYRVSRRGGPDHAPEFEVEVCVEGLEPALGKGGSKREAEQAAAGAMLARLGWVGG